MLKCFEKILTFIGLKRPMYEEFRTIYVNHKQLQSKDQFHEEKYSSNHVVTSRYTALNFLIKNLLEQFSRVANFYFLIISVVQLGIDSPVSPASSFLPLVCVMGATAIKQAYEDILRHRADDKVNNALVKVIRDEALVDVKAFQIRVGDVVRIHKDESFPCDLVLLSSSEDSGECNITTANLDGETNLKTVYSVEPTKPMRSASSICKSLRARITCEQPTTDLYKFKGNMVVRHKSRPYDKVTLSVKNLLLRGAVLRNTEYAIGVAVYTGQETKMQLNSQHVRPKKSVIERRLDKFLLFFMIALLIESIFCTAMKWGYATLDGTVTGAWYVSAETATPWRVIQDLLGFIVLFNYLIPISLYVTIELQKFIGSIFFGFDLDMYFEDPETGEKLRAKANTSDLNEELGQVQYLFSDKTGTLTENKMTFRKCSIGKRTFCDDNGELWETEGCGGRKLSRRETLDGQELLFFTILALCHTIRVERPKSFDRDSAALAPNDRRYTASEAEVYTYQASSPDEKAFAEAARNYGVIFHGTESGVSILSVTSDGEEVIHRYRILHVLEFDSDRKCMSVILQRSNGTYWLLTKGAESSMLEKCSTGDRDSVVQYSGELALEGLRVLVIAHKELTEEEYRQMSLQLLSAEQDVANREERLIEAYKSVECNLEAVGLTAIEDELQSGVCETITALRDAGIQVWVLTGDKRETAENISLSAGHFTESMQRIRIIDQQSAEGCRESLRCGLEEIETGGSPLSVQYCVVVDGQSLQFLVANEYSELKDSFLELCRRTSAVLCCRCTPLQKARVVSMVRNGIKPEPTTCAIGDGANDVSMIREAHVGIGIFGKEGRAAALNSDYCFAKFRFSRNALLFHGHLYYVRLAVLVLFFFYKNVAFITAELYYAFFSAFTAQSVYDTLFLTIYNMTMTALPVLLYGLFEQHLPRHRLESEPSLYRNIAQNRKLWWRELGGWCTIGLWHSVCCFFGVAAVFLVNDWVGTNGFVFDVYAFGTVVVYCVLACVTARILIVTFSFNVPALIGLLVTAIGFVLVLCIYSVSTVTLLSNHLTFLWAYFDISLQPISWLLLLCVSVLALTPDIILRSMQDIRTDRLLRRRGTAGELPDAGASEFHYSADVQQGTFVNNGFERADRTEPDSHSGPHCSQAAGSSNSVQFSSKHTFHTNEAFEQQDRV
ncbi:hypothetical protein BOX15_Mlig014952g2 [Macrostomum lignano]|uniref:Uncharacterized protein n=2 Tax=Macrostomum lignano TaxID=282301 RepID=A0A267DQ13_9PLAT|nr:hypothetical protein BOX15_Mlig014952g2 [Macrostomum lignano]